MNEAAEPGIEDLKRELGEAARRAEEEHRMANIGRLSASVVHEISAPIGSILSNNETVSRSLEVLRELLKKEGPVPPKAFQLLETLANLAEVDRIACERIQAVIRNLKTFSRVDEGDLRKVNIHTYLDGAIKLAGAQFRDRIEMVTDYGSLPEIECYPHKLSQVFLNLVMNAGQAIEGRGRITVETRLEGEMAHITVADTGKGIRPQDREKILSGGFTTKPLGVGTGLGLRISREIVNDLHHGVMDFESDVGVGTRFHVRVPIRQPDKTKE